MGFCEQDNINGENKIKIVIKGFVIHVFIVIEAQKINTTILNGFAYFFCVGWCSYGQKLFEQFVETKINRQHH